MFGHITSPYERRILLIEISRFERDQCHFNWISTIVIRILLIVVVVVVGMIAFQLTKKTSPIIVADLVQDSQRPIMEDCVLLVASDLLSKCL